MGMKLFEDDNDTQNSDEISKIEINKEFARRFEHNKKREDLQRLEELKKKGVVESSSEEEESSLSDEDDEDEEQVDLQFFNALLKVRNQDPSLKLKDVKLFNDDGDGGEVEGESIERDEKKKAMYLKDVVAKQLIEEGPEFDEDGENGNVGKEKRKKKKKSYAEEQEEMRTEFLKAVEAAEEGEEGDGDFLRVKEKGSGEGEEEEGEEAEEFKEKLEEYFGGGNEELDENSRFLKEFFMNKLWLDKEGKGKKGGVDGELDELLKDEEEIEKQEEYETNYR